MDVASLRVLFTADGDGSVVRAIDKVNTKLGTVDGHAKRAGSAIDGMFRVAGGFLLAQGITNAVGGVLQMNSNAEQAKAALEIALGSAEEAESTFQRVQKMAAETPFSTQELLDSTLQLESLGLSSERWMTTIGDAAAGTNKSVDQVTQAVLDASFGEYERLKEFGIQARVEGDKVAFSYIKNGKQITETVDKNNKEIIQSTIEGIWNDKYAGAMAKQSKTFAGQWSTLKDNAAIAMMGLTGGVFSGLTDILGFANEVFSDGLLTALRNIEGPLAGLGEGLADAIGYATSFANAFRAAFGSGVGIDKIVEFLPEQLAALEQPILAVADALGDMWAAFRSGGVGDFLDVLIGELGNIVDAGIDLGTLAVNFAEVQIQNIAGWAADAIPGIQAWIDDHPADSIIQSVQITELKPVLDAVSRGDYVEAIKRFLEADPIEVTPQIELRISNAVNNFLTGGGAGEGGGIDWGQLVTVLQNSYLLANPGQVFGKWVADDIVRAVGAAFVGALPAFVATVNNVGDAIAAPFETLQTDFQKLSENLYTKIKGIGTALDLGGDLLGNVPTPDLPGWLTDFGWITGPINTLISTIDGMIGLVRNAFARLRDAVTGGGGGSPEPTGGAMGLNFLTQGMYDNLMGVTGNDLMGGTGPEAVPVEIPVTVKPVVESVDWSVIKESLNPFGGGFGDGGNSPFGDLAAKVKITADATEYDATIGTVKSDLAAFDAQTWTGTLAGDNGPAAVAYTEAMSWGGIWGGSTFTGTFAGDNGPAAVAYTEAFGWGNAWAGQVFTASFSVDTSGITNAVAVARQAAADIAAVMPHSPAKEGPLREPIRFDYIADSFRASMRRIKSEAELGMHGVRSAMDGSVAFGGGRSGAIRRGGVQVGTAYIYPATGDVQREINASAIGAWRSQ